jgi:flavin reductase (DIM6/NTAB) family NADH-FMN oxidoreductase RutF
MKKPVRKRVGRPVGHSVPSRRGRGGPGAALRGFPLSRVYQLLEPGPVVLLTTSHKGRANVMAMSWHMMVEFEPPLVACVVSSADHSFIALKATGQCVIAIPARELASKVVRIGNCSGRNIAKFQRFRLTEMPAQRVIAPLIAECIANLECRVVNTSLVGKYNLFVLEVLKAWAIPGTRTARTIHHQGCGRFVVDGGRFTLKSAMR